MAYESKLMQLKDLGLLQECEVVLQATRDTGGNLRGKTRSLSHQGKSVSIN
jgi:hypothetical protein